MSADKKKDPIAHILNVTPVVGQENAVVVYEEHDSDQTQINQDIEKARQALIESIETAQDLTDSLVEIAKQSQHPRAFEVAATLITQIRESSKDLMDLHKKKKELKGIDESSNQNPGTINNNLFVGSTSELLKMIKQQREEEK